MDIHEGISEKVSGTVSTSAFLLDMTVMSSSGVIVSPSDVPVGQLQPLTTVVICTDVGFMVTPFVVPPSPDIEQPCRQLQDSLTCRTPQSRQPWLLCNLSAISSTHTMPGKLPEFSSFSSSIDRFQPLRRESSVRRATPCCRRRRMTVCVRVWIHVYLHRPNAFGFWQMRLHLCYETLKRISNFSELA